VGHSIVNGKDVLDFPRGTRFYVYHLRRYVIVEDTCGDGDTPQNKPCHDLRQAPAQATAWIDVYVGGSAHDSRQALRACARRVDGGTELHTVLMNPSKGLPVDIGPLFRRAVGDAIGSCAA
jgi:hypothetical protein